MYSNMVPDEVWPKPPTEVKHILGYGDSPLIYYQGTGIYTVDLSDNQISVRIEPDSKWLKEPWKRDLLVGPVTELDYNCKHTFELKLAGWDAGNCKASRIQNGNKAPVDFLDKGLKFEVQPGDYLIERD